MRSRLYKLILFFGILASCFGQNSYTVTPIHGPSALQEWTIRWISDDGKNSIGYGFYDLPASLSQECFTYQNGTAAILPTPGFDCSTLPLTPGAINAGMYLLALKPRGSQVVGLSDGSLVLYVDGTFRTVPLPKDFSVTDLSIPAISQMNKKGQIAVAFNCSSGGQTVPCAYILSSDGTLQRLPDLGGESAALAINDEGDVAGFAVPPGGDRLSGRHVILWPHTGGMTDLSALTDLRLGIPVSINSKSQIVGGSPYSISNPPYQLRGAGYFYDGAGKILPIQIDGSMAVYPGFLNDNGEVVGTYTKVVGNNFLDYPLYYANGQVKDLNSMVANLPVDMFLAGASYITNAGKILAGAVFTKQPIGTFDNGTEGTIFLLSPSNATALPVIGGVKNAASHLAGVASSAWIEVQGLNLSTTTRSWTSSDFTGSKLPTSLDGVSVTINGLPAYLDFVSPEQINVLAPDDAATGSVQVQVTNALGVSAPFTVTKSDAMPALLNSQLSASSAQTHGQVVAMHANGSPVGYPNTDGCASCVPALPGETIALFGTGFGATKTPAPASQMVSDPAQLANPVTVAIGGKSATVTFAGRVSSGLDQVNVTIPDGLPGGEAFVVATVEGLSTPDYLFMATGPAK
jgi:uncharacterized protein (TIGR03437 family)